MPTPGVYPQDLDYQELKKNANGLYKFMNSPAGTANINLVGNDNGTLAQLVEDARAAAEAAANLQTYLSYDSPSEKRMVDDESQPVGTPGRVTNDTDLNKNGNYTMTSSGWVRDKIQPASVEALLAEKQDRMRADEVLEEENTHFAVEIFGFYSLDDEDPETGFLDSSGWVIPLGGDLGNLPHSELSVSQGKAYLAGRQVLMRPIYDADYSAVGETFIPDYATLISKYDSVASSAGITKVELGTASDGQKLYRYTVPTFPITGVNAQGAPTIVISGGPHGHEKRCQQTVFLLFRELATNWNRDEALMFLRPRVNVVIIPSINPFGIDNTTRKNYNGVDLNRNWPAGWNAANSDPDSPNYRGPSPLSEPESQAYYDYVEATDALTFLDCHNGSTVPSGASLWVSTSNDRPKDLALAARVLRISGAKMINDSPEIPLTGSTMLQQGQPSSGTITRGVNGTLLKSGFLFEMPYLIYSDHLRTVLHNLTNLKTMLVEVVKRYEIETYLS